jgi:hypothetical protein
MTLTTLKLVYKNMIWNRPKVGLYGLIAVAMISTTNLFFSLLKFGHTTTAVFTLLSLSLWFFGLPCAMTLIDLHVNPKRMNTLLATIHDGHEG